MDRIVAMNLGKDGRSTPAVYRTVVSCSLTEPHSCTIFHFFQKEYTYTCHGAQAVAIAKQFYRTANVVKYEQSLETLEVGSKLFSTIIGKLICDRLPICIWHKEANDWVVWKRGSPGNIVQLEEFISSGNTAILSPYMAYITVQVPAGKGKELSVQLGIALISTSLRRAIIIDSIDAMDAFM